MTTTEVLKNGAGALAETAVGAVSEAKDRLAERRSSHRGRTVLIGAAIVSAAAAVFRLLRSRGLLGHRREERVIDLTQDPVAEPESLPTH